MPHLKVASIQKAYDPETVIYDPRGQIKTHQPVYLKYEQRLFTKTTKSNHKSLSNIRKKSDRKSGLDV